MLTVHVLGSSGGRPSAERDTCALAVESPEGCSLVDCPGGVVHKLARLQVAPEQLRRLILTHNHVDHIYGLPHLLHAMAILGEPVELVVHAPQQTLTTVAAMVATHSLDGPRYPALDMRPIPMAEGTEVAVADPLRVWASPAAHGRDTVALRFEADGIAFCHSSDTRPSEVVTRLAADVGLLLHDCAGPHCLRERFSDSHSSALEAARVAASAGVGKLALIHLGPEAESDPEGLVAEAGEAFAGPVVLASDGDVYRFAR